MSVIDGENGREASKGNKSVTRDKKTRTDSTELYLRVRDTKER